MRKTDATFKVKGAHVDGKNEGTLIVQAPSMTGVVFVSYRPKGARREYKVFLKDVAEMVASRAAKQGTVYETIVRDSDGE